MKDYLTKNQIKCIHLKTSHAAQTNKRGSTYYLTCTLKFDPVGSLMTFG